ncbi:MAG: S8/S53 family peptidase [Elusimicrobiota bacterium]|nr:S8/S53 family peptidase [Elusimicrobiota bacterium]
MTILLIGLLSLAAPAAAVSSQVPSGYWESVDLVDSIDAFAPGRRSWPEDLFLKDFECATDGRCSLGWTCKGGWTTHADGKTRAPYTVMAVGGESFLFLPWLSGDVTVRGMKPSFYVLKKADKTAVRPRKESVKPSGQIAQSTSTIKPFDDVRGKDLSGADFSGRPDLVGTLTFNERTVWPEPAAMGKNDDPRRLMSSALNPGLGVRALHGQGITGTGVNVAIIDQPLLDDHPEFAGKLAAYRDFGCGSDSSMHGPAVASLLVGAKCGTAPGAKVYYAAVPSWKADASYYARALDWILEQNAGLNGREKIRVVSVSAVPSGRGSPFTKDNKAWDEARGRARAQGVLVLDATEEEGIIGPCHHDPRDPENVSKCEPGFPGRGGRFSGLILAPVAPRAVAEQYKRGEPSYQYNGRAGLSWAIPYAAGVLALGWQARPDLSAERMQEMLFRSARVTKQGEKIIDPAGFIELVKTAR